MLELVQIPWSPYCIVQRRILEYSGARFKITNIPATDRSLVWKLTKNRYYQVPIVRQDKNVVFETDENSQVVAKFLDEELDLDLFPHEWRGVQSILWRYIENEIEGIGFKLNDIYWQEFVSAKEQLNFLRHKERKFGRGCIQHWQAEQDQLLRELSDRLAPFEQQLLHKSFLLDERPYFVDFDLFGMLGNFLYSGHYELPQAHPQLKAWHKRMAGVTLPKPAREKLHT